MLDTLEKAWADSNNGEVIWHNKDVKFLDPFTKSGVFLREITQRLTKGLENEIPDLQSRVDHILTKQVFGIAVTELTSLLARRSLYCSKFANGPHSAATKFDKPEGNIWFEPQQHLWVGGNENIVVFNEKTGDQEEKKINGRCKYCGAPQKDFDRPLGTESYAYKFIHNDDIKTTMHQIFGEDMHFDVIIGNPPYQLDDGGYGTSAGPIYNKFVEQAKELNPRFLSMVIPARWFAGGKGLDNFRDVMLNDKRIRVIHDFPDSSDVFPGVQIKGGVCFFLWNRDNPGNCDVATHLKDMPAEVIKRPLLEEGAEVFIRYNQAISILKKVFQNENGVSVFRHSEGNRFIDIVSSSKPYGLRTYFQGKKVQSNEDLLVYQNGGIGFCERKLITKNEKTIDKWKVFSPSAGSGSDSFPHPILGKPFLGSPGSISTETYNFYGPFKGKTEALNVLSYATTRFFRFLVLLHKPSQDASRSVYTFVPMQDFSKPWTDEELYAKYGITEEEIAFIESLIRPMELDNE
jgi:site-specific DNA-methyltransferase (adenine-specific)